ncbi:MAG: glycine cleavage system aminomethyltransferase GcvT [Candidatus Sericytochromatia bacterium]
MELKRTKLYEKNKELGAKFVDFAGWEMPVQFSNLVDEHNTVRNKVGIFDVSHMGTFVVSGNNSFSFLQKMIPNDLNKIKIGKAIYTQFCKEDGTVIDDLIIYYVSENIFYIVVNASNIEKDFSWLNKNIETDVKLENISAKTCLLAVQGPLAEKTMSKLVSDNLTEIPSFGLIKTSIDNVEMILSRTGYTGEDGFELIFDNKNAPKIYDLLLEAGKEYDIRPIGLGARDTLRLESNLPLYGHELNEQTTPLEAKLAWSVKLTKENFIGKEALVLQKEKGLNKILIGIKTSSRAAIPREGYEISYENKIIGKVTSGTFSPTLNYPIGLAIVENIKDFKQSDLLEITIRGKNHQVEVINLPFYKRKRGV